MSATNHGGAAFPLVGGHEHIVETGMSLRDYFAAKALQGLIAGAPQYVHGDGNLYISGQSHERARTAYLEADAMLKAREE